MVRLLLKQFYCYSFFHHAPADLVGSRTVVQLPCDWSEVHRGRLSECDNRREEEAVKIGVNADEDKSHED